MVLWSFKGPFAAGGHTVKKNAIEESKLRTGISKTKQLN